MSIQIKLTFYSNSKEYVNVLFLLFETNYKLKTDIEPIHATHITNDDATIYATKKTFEVSQYTKNKLQKALKNHVSHKKNALQFDYLLEF